MKLFNPPLAAPFPASPPPPPPFSMVVKVPMVTLFFILPVVEVPLRIEPLEEACMFLGIVAPEAASAAVRELELEEAGERLAAPPLE